MSLKYSHAGKQQGRQAGRDCGRGDRVGGRQSEVHDAGGTRASWREAGPPNHHDDKVDSD